MPVEVIAKKWGNSIGFILPKEIVRHRHIKPKQKVLIEFVNPGDLSGIFGSLPRTASGQEAKDFVRRGWGQ